MAEINNAILERVEATLKDFREGTKYTNDLSVRIGKRTTSLLRVIAFCFLLIGILLAYLITTLRVEIGDFLGEMKLMNSNVEKMTTAVLQMDQTTQSMSSYLTVIPTVMPAMSQDLTMMSKEVGTMNQHIKSMTQQMQYLPLMSKNMEAMGQDTFVMSSEIVKMKQEMQGINYILDKMSKDMGKISKPMRMFP